MRINKLRLLNYKSFADSEAVAVHREDMDVMREAVEERAGDRGWIPGYLQVAPGGRLHLVSCAPHGLIVAEWLVSDARLSETGDRASRGDPKYPCLAPGGPGLDHAMIQIVSERQMLPPGPRAKC